jgi:hypothetical protein
MTWFFVPHIVSTVKLQPEAPALPKEGGEGDTEFALRVNLHFAMECVGAGTICGQGPAEGRVWDWLLLSGPPLALPRRFAPVHMPASNSGGARDSLPTGPTGATGRTSARRRSWRQPESAWPGWDQMTNDRSAELTTKPITNDQFVKHTPGIDESADSPILQSSNPPQTPFPTPDPRPPSYVS